VTVFEATGAEIAARVQQITGWLGEGRTVSVVEYTAGEPADRLIARVESGTRHAVGAV